MFRNIISNRSSILVILFFSAFLWDLRPFGQRVFDLIPLTICGLYCLINLKNIRMPSRVTLITGMAILTYCWVGYVSYNHKSSFIIGVMALFFLILKEKIVFCDVSRILKYLYIFNLLIYFFQFALFHATGFLVDFQVPFGDVSRVNYSGLFRPVGINSEPHSFCVSVVMLTLMTLRQKEMKYWHYWGCFSLLVSLSLWGMIVLPVLLLLLLSLYDLSIRQLLQRYVAVFSIMAIGLSILYGFIIPQNTFDVMIERVTTVTSDASLHERFAEHQVTEQSLEKNDIKSRPIKNGQSEIAQYVSIVFGSGLSTFVFLEGTALNSVSFIYETMGVIGLLGLVVGLYFFIVKCVTGGILMKVAYSLTVCVLLTSYPMVTYAFFWLFLATVLSNERQKWE